MLLLINMLGLYGLPAIPFQRFRFNEQSKTMPIKHLAVIIGLTSRNFPALDKLDIFFAKNSTYGILTASKTFLARACPSNDEYSNNLVAF